MKAALINFFSPPKLRQFQQAQKSIILHVALLVTAAGSLLIAFLNFQQMATGLALLLLLLSIVSLGGVYLNHRGHYTLASVLLLVFLTSAIDFNLIDGAALHDPGVAAFPLLILFSGLLLELRGIALGWLVSLLSLVIIYGGHQAGWLSLQSVPTLNRALILAILYSAIAGVTWALILTFMRSADRVREAYEETIEGWATALELRDLETVGHSKRVTTLAVSLGRQLGLSGPVLEDLRRGALLHDIGKIAIPDSILLKPGKLSDEEFERIKEHTTYAYELLRGISYLERALDVPHYHHERWDGQGYPAGLSGTEIPYLARIFAIIDQWDAVRSPRPYRHAWSDERALEFIKSGSGTRYDPQIVVSFLQLIESWNKRVPDHFMVDAN